MDAINVSKKHIIFIKYIAKIVDIIKYMIMK